MKSMVAVIITIVVMTLLAGLALGIVAWSGMINVAASADYLPGAEGFFGTLSENSIRKQAARAVDEGRITPPEEITQAMLDEGRHHYVEMCVVCHGAPGVDRGEVGQGLKPLPPELSHSAEEFTISEIYWVTEHGIRHTGMPAFGRTHSPEELWGLAAFVEELETMTPEEYQRLTAPPPTGTGGPETESPQAESGDDHGEPGHTH